MAQSAYDTRREEQRSGRNKTTYGISPKDLPDNFNSPYIPQAYGADLSGQALPMTPEAQRESVINARVNALDPRSVYDKSNWFGKLGALFTKGTTYDPNTQDGQLHIAANSSDPAIAEDAKRQLVMQQIQQEELADAQRRAALSESNYKAADPSGLLKEESLKDLAYQGQKDQNASQLEIEKVRADANKGLLAAKQANAAEAKQKAEAKEIETKAVANVKVVDDILETAQGILDSEDFGNYFNSKLNPYSLVADFNRDDYDTTPLVKQLSSQEYMQGVQKMRGTGSLSDAEGAKLQSLLGDLDKDQGEASAKKLIARIVAQSQLLKDISLQEAKAGHSLTMDEYQALRGAYDEKRAEDKQAASGAPQQPRSSSGYDKSKVNIKRK